MSVEAKTNNKQHADSHVSVRTYVTGYLLSITLTLATYILVRIHTGSGSVALSRDVAIGAIAVFALSQFVVQMVCFLHLGRETKPRWKLGVFWFMVMVVLILVFGTLWIMNNLNYRMEPTPTQINQYMQSQGDL